MPHELGRHCGPKLRSLISQSINATIQEWHHMGQEPTNQNRDLPLGYSGDSPWVVLKSWAPAPIIPRPEGPELDTPSLGQGRHT